MIANVQDLRARLNEALNILDGIEAALARVPIASRHADAISNKVPPGHDTILGYLAKHQPEILDTVDYADPEVTKRDGWALAHACRRKGLRAVYTPAPAALKRRGILVVRAYPVELLEARWQ
jgi:hypothetical protein